MVNDEHALHAGSFGAGAAAYERGRPAYPDAAVEWLVPPGARRVLDLGAGTGKLTRSLAARGLEVTAVEPSEGMRVELERVLPGVRALAGSAEDIPVADGSVDAVLVAQAWHWVDPVRAVPEVARVLRPGGQLGLVWNMRDEREEWVAQLGRLLHPHGDQHTSGAHVDALEREFGPVERHTVEWAHRLSPAQLVDMVASRSYVLVLPETERAALLEEVHALTAGHPALKGRDEIAMPYVTDCFRARLTA